MQQTHLLHSWQTPCSRRRQGTATLAQLLGARQLLPACLARPALHSTRPALYSTRPQMQRVQCCPVAQSRQWPRLQGWIPGRWKEQCGVRLRLRLLLPPPMRRAALLHPHQLWAGVGAVSRSSTPTMARPHPHPHPRPRLRLRLRPPVASYSAVTPPPPPLTPTPPPWAPRS
jgi:hypothetical protein